ncbi:hypothetical protein ACVWXU_007620 [Streptomyces sp. TE33382]
MFFDNLNVHLRYACELRECRAERVLLDLPILKETSIPLRARGIGYRDVVFIGASTSPCVSRAVLSSAGPDASSPRTPDGTGTD